MVGEMGCGEGTPDSPNASPAFLYLFLDTQRASMSAIAIAAGNSSYVDEEYESAISQYSAAIAAKQQRPLTCVQLLI